MQVDRLEHRIRAVPGVVACQLTGAAALVLVAPGTDARGVHAAVTAVLLDAAAAMPVQVLGAAPASAGGRRRRRHALALVGSAAALSVGVAAAATITPIDAGRSTGSGAPARSTAGSPQLSASPHRSTGATADAITRAGLAAEPIATEIARGEAPDARHAPDAVDGGDAPMLLAIPLPGAIAAAAAATPAARFDAATDVGDAASSPTSPAGGPAEADDRTADPPVLVATADPTPGARQPQGRARRVRRGFALPRPPLPAVPAGAASEVATAEGARSGTDTAADPGRAGHAGRARGRR
ncbi:MAG TPA: hypothetical protein VHN98_08695 [Acidimicrobiales bacterium]|nr:hypothetical protein [Acidimicrobiales bacterium]